MRIFFQMQRSGHTVPYQLLGGTKGSTIGAGGLPIMAGEETPL